MMSGDASEPPKVLVLEESHVGLAVLNNLKAEMKQLHTVLWADDHIPVEVWYQSLTVGVRGILRKSWPAEVTVAMLEQVAAGELCFESNGTVLGQCAAPMVICLRHWCRIRD